MSATFLKPGYRIFRRDRRLYDSRIEKDARWYEPVLRLNDIAIIWRAGHGRVAPSLALEEARDALALIERWS